MTKLRYTFFKGKLMWVGWMNDYPEYVTEGETIEELEENLRDIYEEIVNGTVPGLRQSGELVIN